MKNIYRDSRRDGVSLVELIVIMSAASVILSLSAGLIHRIMHAETKSRSLAAIERTSLRLAESLRRDINGAVSAVTDEAQLADGAFIQLNSSSGGRTEYRRDEQTIYRLQLAADRVVARDQFVFPSNVDVKVQLGGSRLLVLTVTSRNEPSSAELEDPIHQANSLAVDLQVVAALQGASP